MVETKRIVTSADGRTVTTACDLDGNGSTDLTTSSVTVVNADGSQVNTAAQRNGNGSLRTQTVTTMSADQRTIGITRDVNGDGAIDQTETIVIQANGSTVDTVSTFNANGSLKDRKITTTSANGLSTTTQLDLNGDGAIDETLTDVIVLNGDGSRTETFTDYNGTTSGSIKDRVVTTTSANGLSSTVQWSGAIGQESLNQTQTDVTVVNVDGSLVETISDFTPAGVLKDRKVVTTAANGLSTTMQLDLDGNGSFERVDAIVFGVDGSKTETITRSNSSNGALVQKDVLATSADGRSRSLQRDTDGNGSFDHYESAATNLDGSTTGTIWNTKANGALKDKVIAIRSADGLATTVRTDSNGDGTTDYTWTTAADLNADGSRVDTTSWVNGNGTLWNQAVTTTSANGLSKATRIDTNGDGVLDQVRYETTVINTDGTTTETVSDIYCADGSLKSRSVRTVSADGNTRTTQVDDNGDGTVDRTIVAVLAADGSETLSETYFDPDSTLKAQATAAISFDGRTTTILKSGAILRSDSITETTTVAADGSGSYSWVQVQFDNTSTGYASHVIDAAGVDTWTWSEEPTGVTPPVGHGGGTIAIPYASIRIDLATETRYLEIANRLYDTAFDRDMFRDEREFLAKYIGNGVFNTTALANDLMNSVEFSQRYGDPAVPRPDFLSNAQFIERVYQNALGHAASLAELSSYLSQLTAGTMTRADVMYAVSESAEHVAAGNVHAITNNTATGSSNYSLDYTTDKTTIADIIQRMYDLSAGRDASAPEVDYWATQLLDGTITQIQMAATLAEALAPSSPMGGATNAQFVSLVFQAAFERLPTAAESQYWTAALDASWLTRGEFFDAVAQSTDHITQGNIHPDTLQTAATATLSGSVAKLILTGTAAVDGTGNALNNVITGNSGNNVLSGLAGADKLQGRGGNDTIIGGADTDTAVFSGRRSDYAITFNATTQAYTVVDLRDGSPDGTDTVSGVEQFQFSDGTIAAAAVSDRAPTYLALSGGAIAVSWTGNGGAPTYFVANGTSVGTVTGVDPDGSTGLQYSLVHSAGGRFTINGSTGQLTVANGQLIGSETTTAYVVTIRVTDQYGLTFDEGFAINVARVHGGTMVGNPPSNATLTGGTVAEGATNGTVVATISGVDPNAGAVLTYSLTNNAGGRFAINGNTGQVTVANGSLLDYESATSHAITVRVTDEGNASQSGMSFDKTFTINVTSVNAAPTNATLTGGSVAENAANGTVVGTVAGVDPDAGATLSYSLLNSAGGRFAINASTGQLTVANGSLLDFESATSHANHRACHGPGRADLRQDIHDQRH